MSLHSCLTLLRQQTDSGIPYEIIVIDNDDLPLDVGARPSDVTYIHHPQGYSYSARNAGIRVAKGAIVAFTDADCLPQPGWLLHGCHPLLSVGGPDLVGGAVEMFADKQSLASAYECLYSFRQAENISKHKVSVTANLFVKRSVFDHLGAFREDFESGGDYEFCRRAASANHRIEYAEGAIVRHPARAGLGALLQRRARVARGHFQSHFLGQNMSFGRSLRSSLGMFRPDWRDWRNALQGPSARQVLPRFSSRLGLCGLRIFLKYHYAAWVLCSVLKARLAKL